MYHLISTKKNLPESHVLAIFLYSGILLLIVLYISFQKACRLFEKKNWNEAIPKLEELLYKLEKILGKKSSAYQKNLFMLSISYIGIEQYKKAEEYFLCAIEIWKNTEKQELSQYLNIFIPLIYLYVKSGECEKEKQLLVELGAIREKLFNEAKPDCIKLLSKLVSFYQRRSDDKNTERCLLSIREIQRQNLPQEQTLYLESLEKLVDFYEKKEDYTQVEVFLREAKEIRKKIRERDIVSIFRKLLIKIRPVLNLTQPLISSQKYLSNLFKLADLYENTCQYNKAEWVLGEAKDEIEKFWGKYVRYYTIYLCKLGRISLVSGC